MPMLWLISVPGAHTGRWSGRCWCCCLSQQAALSPSPLHLRERSALSSKHKILDLRQDEGCA